MVESMGKTGYNNLRYSIVKQAVDDYVLAEKKIKQLNDVDKAIAQIFKEDVKRKARRCYTYADAENERQDKLFFQKSKQADIERFFNSSWYKFLCDIDSDYMIQRTKEKASRV